MFFLKHGVYKYTVLYCTTGKDSGCWARERWGVASPTDSCITSKTC